MTEHEKLRLMEERLKELNQRLEKQKNDTYFWICAWITLWLWMFFVFLN